MRLKPPFDSVPNLIRPNGAPTLDGNTLYLAVTMLGVGALNVLWVSFLKSGFGYTSSAELGWREEGWRRGQHVDTRGVLAGV